MLSNKLIMETSGIRNSSYGFLSFQQDTVPPILPADTIEKAPLGIDPLFLMIERKALEVEAYKAEAAQREARVVRRPAPAPVDTTCHICPKGDSVTLQTLVLSESIEFDFFGLQKLYDKSFYREFVGPSGPVLIETVAQSTNFSKDLKAIPINQNENLVEWIFFPLMALIVLVGVIKVFFYNHISSLFRSAVYFFLASKLTRDNSVLWNRIFFLLDILFFFSLPLLIVISYSHLRIISNLEYSPFTIAIYVFFGLLGLRAFRYLTTKLIGIFSNNQEPINTLYFNQLLYPRVLGLVTAPLLILIVYSKSPIREGVFFALISFIALLLITRTIRTIQVFISKGFSVFYLFLYLCALEIIPILVVIKEVFWE